MARPYAQRLTKAARAGPRTPRAPTDSDKSPCWSHKFRIYPSRFPSGARLIRVDRPFLVSADRLGRPCQSWRLALSESDICWSTTSPPKNRLGRRHSILASHLIRVTLLLVHNQSTKNRLGRLHSILASHLIRVTLLLVHNQSTKNGWAAVTH